MIWDESKHPRDDIGRFTDGKSDEIKKLTKKSAGELKELAAQKSDAPKSAPNTNPVVVGKVNFADEDEINRTLEAYEKLLVNLPYESSITITTDGKVWQVDGTESSVDPTVIPHSLEGSYSYHNHPKEYTWYSFSAEDVEFFLTHKEQSSRASDDKYFYSMTRTDETPSNVQNIRKVFEITYLSTLEKSLNGVIDIDLDGYHETMLLLAKRYNFRYERRKK